MSISQSNITFTTSELRKFRILSVLRKFVISMQFNSTTNETVKNNAKSYFVYGTRSEISPSQRTLIQSKLNAINPNRTVHFSYFPTKLSKQFAQFSNRTEFASSMKGLAFQRQISFKTDFSIINQKDFDKQIIAFFKHFTDNPIKLSETCTFKLFPFIIFFPNVSGRRFPMRYQIVQQYIEKL